MYQLYYSAGACSLAVHAILNEIGQPVELISASLSEGKNRTPEFLKINPRGSVPVLVDDGHVIREGAAQIIYLLDKHKSDLLPASGIARATALEWLMFCNATLHPAYSRVFGARKSNAEESVKAAITSMAIKYINQLWAEVDAHLANHSYLCGEQLTAADILMTVIANWSSGFPITLGANVTRMLKDASSRPAFQKALTAEGVTYKMAA
jgi:glutathione S-transferase